MTGSASSLRGRCEAGVASSQNTPTLFCDAGVASDADSLLRGRCGEFAEHADSLLGQG